MCLYGPGLALPSHSSVKVCFSGVTPTLPMLVRGMRGLQWEKRSRRTGADVHPHDSSSAWLHLIALTSLDEAHTEGLSPAAPGNRRLRSWDVSKRLRPLCSWLKGWGLLSACCCECRWRGHSTRRYLSSLPMSQKKLPEQSVSSWDSTCLQKY